MRLIKVKRSSRTAGSADLDDSLVIEVGELNAPSKLGEKQPGQKKLGEKRLGKKNTRSPSKTGVQGKKRRAVSSLSEPFVAGALIAETRDESNSLEIETRSDLFSDSDHLRYSRKNKRDRSSNVESSHSQAKSSASDVYNRGIYLLSMREHSVKELSDKLAQKFPMSDEVEAAVQKLVANDYVSDDRFTEAYVRQRTNKGLGPIKIRAELYKKGIKNNLVEEYLDFDSPAWQESALAVYQRKFGGSEVEDYKDWARRARFLQGRGYSSKHIEFAVPDICI